MDLFTFLINATMLSWFLAEVVMQVRQYRMGGRAVSTEWRSLGVVAGSVVLGQALALTAKSVASGADYGQGRPALAVAVLVMWVGIVLRLWAIQVLGRFFRGVVHVQADHEVVTDGPYRVLRHPAYSGAMVAVLGLGLAYGNPVSLVLLVGCTLVGVVYRIRVEEKVLTTALGNAYASYAAGTSRLVPGVW